jgi:crossover junction endodeoxyribonuclease RuvC
MRVLGIDPGTVTTGWGVVEESGARLRRVAGGVVRARGALPARLAAILRAMEEILVDFAPIAVSLEKSFVATNVQSAFRLGEARGTVMAAAARAGVAVTEYSPTEIKRAVVGSGGATKEQVQEMVRRILGLEKAVGVDQADALATAVCHLHSFRFSLRAGGPPGVIELMRSRRGVGRRWRSRGGAWR